MAMPLVLVVPLVFAVPLVLMVAHALVVLDAAGVCGLSVLLAGDGRVRTGEQHRDDQASNDPDSFHGFSSSP
jgi:hypothetical protein